MYGYKYVVFDLDETLGYFTELGIFWDSLKSVLKKNLTQVKNYDGIIESFYENSKKIIDDFVNLVNVNKNEKTIILKKEHFLHILI